MIEQCCPSLPCPLYAPHLVLLSSACLGCPLCRVDPQLSMAPHYADSGYIVPQATCIDGSPVTTGCHSQVWAQIRSSVSFPEFKVPTTDVESRHRLGPIVAGPLQATTWTRRTRTRRWSSGEQEAALGCVSCRGVPAGGAHRLQPAAVV